MARQKAPCGTYSAYRRHRREGSEPCGLCVRAKNEYNASRSVSATGREREEAAVRVEESVPVEADSLDAFDRRAELLRTLEFVDRAIGAAIGDDPVKLAPLIRERRELIAELGPVEVVEEVDPFDEFLAGEGNVVRFDSAKGREAS